MTTSSAPATPGATAPVSAPGSGSASGNSASAERVHRPWGWYETLASATPAAEDGSRRGYGVKRLWIEAHSRISLQRHHQRSEHWVVVAGSGLLECGEARIEAQPGTTLAVPVGAVHRASAGPEGLLIIEVQRGEVLREEDIERFADDYGRERTTAAG